MAQPPSASSPSFSSHDKSLPRCTVRAPGKALLFGEYGLLAGGPGLVITVPDHAFVVELDFVPTPDSGGATSDAVVARFESSHYEGGAVEITRAAWDAAAGVVERGEPRDRIALPRDALFAFGTLFPYFGELEGLASREGAFPLVRVRGSFPPSLGLGSSSALIAAVHECARRLIGAPPAFVVDARGESQSVMQASAWNAARVSLGVTQGRGSGYDVVAQAYAIDTLEPRFLRIEPSPSRAEVRDLSVRVFDAWSREAREIGFDLRIVPSGVYSDTTAVIGASGVAGVPGVPAEQCGPNRNGHAQSAARSAARLSREDHGDAHSALATEWESAAFALAALPGLFARSRTIAGEQGLFGERGGPFDRACEALSARGAAFKTMGAGHGDSLLVLEPRDTSAREGDPRPAFSLVRYLALRLPPALVPLQESLWRARASGSLLVQAGDRGHASAPSNIALVKYWGKEPGRLQVPCNSSLSFTLGSFRAFTRVEALCSLAPAGSMADLARSGARPAHEVRFGEAPVGPPDPKIAAFLDRALARVAPDLGVRVETVNTFPTACGIASSAAGFAALAAAIAELLDAPRHLGAAGTAVWISEWARVGSGSATRSCFDGEGGRYVAWERRGEGSSTRPVDAAAPLRDLGHGVVVFDARRKGLSSSEGHAGVGSSPLHGIRVAGIPREMERIVAALASGDFAALAAVTERDAFAMHAVMQGAEPPARYFGAATSRFVAAFVSWRDATGTEAFWTLDAGPNVHLLFSPSAGSAVRGFVESYAAACARAGTPGPREWLENASHAGLRIGRRAVEALRADPGSHPVRRALPSATLEGTRKEQAGG